MRLCTNCHRVTIGDPLFCNHCGLTYDAKLCPARHLNPRTAEVCSQCGSRDLSTPAPAPSIWLRPLVFAFTLLPGVALSLLWVLLAISILQAVVSNPDVLPRLLAMAIPLAILWLLYLQLPAFVRKLLRSTWERRKKDGHRH